MFDNPPYRIQCFDPAHWEEVVRLAATCLGEGYLDDLAPVLERPGLVFGIALAEEAVAGFVFGWRLGPGDLDELYSSLSGVARPTVLAAAEAAGTLAILKTIAVSPGHQGRGLGGLLFRGCVDRLRMDGAEALVVPAWTIRGRPNLGPVLDREGCVPFAEIPRPWTFECDHGVFACPHRDGPRGIGGDGGCVCGLRFHGRSLT